MSEQIREYYKKLANDFENNVNFNDFFYNEDEEFDIDDIVDDLVGLDITIGIGASRYVIIPKDNNYVIKLPFVGEQRYEWDDIHDEYDYDRPIYNYFHGGIKGNYCEKEFQLYNRAQEAGIGKCFCNVEKITNHFYLQEKAVIFCGHSSSHSKKEMDSARIYRSSSKRLYDFNLNWIIDFINYYGIEMLKKLDAFMHFHGISDMHGSNYGYSVLDNRPVLIDYATYNE